MNERTSIDTAYKQWRPLLFSALGELARQGLIVLPFDASDLIRDFFAQHTQDLASSFTTHKDAFLSSTCNAFIHFARPRIVRLQRLQHCLVSGAEVYKFYNSQETTRERAPASIYGGSLKKAFRKLSKFERSVLKSYFSMESLSERLLAKKFSLSRYRLLEVVIETLGRLVRILAMRSKSTEQDWTIAQLLWLERRTTYEVAAILDVPQQQVRMAAARNGAWIARGFASRYAIGMAWICTYSPQSPQTAGIVRLLGETLLSPGDNDLLAKVRAQAREILTVLDASEAPGIAEREGASVEPAWLAAVYQSIAEGAGCVSGKQSEAIAALAAFREGDETAVGSAFREALLADLPPSLTNFEEWFEAMIDRDEWQDILKSPEVRSSAPESHPLTLYGITPMTILSVTQTVSRFLNRLICRKVTGSTVSVRGSQFFVSDESGNEINFTIEVINEVMRSVDCSSQSSISLLQWLLHVASYKPNLFFGFRCEVQVNFCRLTSTNKSIDNLYQRWGVGSIFDREHACVES